MNAVAPGWTETPMTRGHVDPATVRRVTRTMALRKVAQPEDVARQVVVLASDELSGHVTGQVVTVAGGMEGRVVHDGYQYESDAASFRLPAAGLAVVRQDSPTPQDDCRQSPTGESFRRISATHQRAEPLRPNGRRRAPRSAPRALSAQEWLPPARSRSESLPGRARRIGALRRCLEYANPATVLESPFRG